MNLEKKRVHLQSLKAEADARRMLPERIADDLVRAFGSFWFAALHLIWFGGWLVINLGFVTGLEPFDPFPFGLLTMIVSLEAIFLSIFVLISQNRSQKIADLREEINLRVSERSEQEVTETLRLVDQIARHLKVKVQETGRVRRMEQDLDAGRLKASIEREIDRK